MFYNLPAITSNDSQYVKLYTARFSWLYTIFLETELEDQHPDYEINLIPNNTIIIPDLHAPAMGTKGSD